MGLGTSPFKIILSFLMFGSGTGIADSKAFEYGCLQLAANLELSSSSII